MNRFLMALFSATLWLTTQVAAAPPNFAMHDAPEPVPELQFTDGAGQARTLEKFKGKVVLLNVWATWCAPCRKEMPTIDRLQAALGGPDFEVVPLSVDRKGLDVVNKFYAETGVQHLSRYVTSSSNDAFEALTLFGLPATLLIDRQGRELGRLVGPAEWDSPDMLAFLKSVIAKQKEAIP